MRVCVVSKEGAAAHCAYVLPYAYVGIRRSVVFIYCVDTINKKFASVTFVPECCVAETKQKSGLMDAPTTAALNWGEIAQRVKGQQGYTAMMRWGKVAHGLTKTEDVVRMQHELMKVRAQWPNTTGAAGKRGIINWRPDMEAMGATEYPSNENSDPTQPGVFAMYDSLYNMRRERSWMKRISRTKWDGTHNWQIQVFRTHRVRASVAAHNMEHPRLTSFVETRQGTSTEAGIAIDIPEDIARGTQFQMEQRLIELLQSAAVEMDYTESHFVIRSFLGGGSCVCKLLCKLRRPAASHFPDGILQHA